MSDEIETILEQACSTPQGELRASFVLGDLEKLASGMAFPETRPHAEAVLEEWAKGSDPLRKGISLAFLSRARQALAPAVRGAVSAVGNATGATAAGKAIGGAAERVAGKVGDLGAAAGEKLAASPLGAKSMAAARAKGGAEAQARMAERLKPNTQFDASRARPGAGGGSAPGGHMALEAAPSPRLAPSAANPVHEEALAAAYRSGADFAARAHAGNAARVGRMAARHSLKVGMQAAGLVGGIAAAGTAARALNNSGGSSGGLSEAQHRERVAAARAPRHRGGDGSTGNPAGSAKP